MSTLFRWKGLQDQQPTQGVLLARNQRDLSAQLNARKIVFISAQRLGTHKRLTLAEMLFLFEQLCPLLHSGIPLLESIQMIADNEKSSRLNNTLKLLSTEISSGRKISETIAQYLPAKEQNIAKMLALGEHNGSLNEMLEKILHQKNREQQVRKRMIQAMIYPGFLGIISVAVMLMLTLWIVPEFQYTYAQMGMTLPFHTQMTMLFSQFLLEYGLLILVLFLGGCFVLRVLLSYSKSMQWFIAQIQLRCPIVGKLYQAYCLRHFSSNLNISYQAGMPIGESLAWLANTSPQPVYRAALKQLQTRVNNGMNLKQALQNTAFFPTLVVQFVDVGERSGTLAHGLKSIEKYYDNQLETATSRLLTLFEPLLIVFIALGIGWIVVTMYLPIFNLGYTF